MFREKLLGVLIKLETTSGVDAVPTGAADAVRLKGIPTFTPGYLEPGLRDDVVTGRLGAVGRTDPAGRFGTIDLSVEVRGAGAAYSVSVVPEAHVLIQIAGFGAALTSTAGSEKYDYWPVDTAFPTATVYGYTANKLIKLLGCVANMSLSVDARGIGVMRFTITGVLASDPTEVTLPALTFISALPPTFKGGAASIGSWLSSAGTDPLVLRSAAIEMANVVTDRPSAGATDGLIGYLITDRKVRQTLTYEVPLLTSHDAFSLSKATGTNQPFTAWQVGTVQYNRMLVSTGRWAMEMPSLGAANGIATQTVAGNLVQGSEPTRQGELLLTFS